MHDLAVLVPSRGRPEMLARLIANVHDTAAGTVHVLAGVDEDDPRLKDYLALDVPGDDKIFYSQTRMNLTEWTNKLAIGHLGLYRYYAVLGDDQIAGTKGWDDKLMNAVDEDFNGTGISYGWDGLRDDVPQEYIVSSDIVEALGWLMMPELKHWYTDDVLADLGFATGCIRQLRGVVFHHLHVGMNGLPGDQTAVDAGHDLEPDRLIYEEWRKDQMFKDIETVRALRESGG